MKNKPEYRIKEHFGEFTIQRRGYVEVRKYFWSKPVEKWDWYHANLVGGVSSHIGVCPTFKTLKDAEQKIKDWLTEPIYHEIAIKG